MLDAALLAAHYGKGAADSLLEVDVTPVRYVRRARDAPPGVVLVTRSETLQLRPDPERLQRLLDSEIRWDEG